MKNTGPIFAKVKKENIFFTPEANFTKTVWEWKFLFNILEKQPELRVYATFKVNLFSKKDILERKGIFISHVLMGLDKKKFKIPLFGFE